MRDGRWTMEELETPSLHDVAGEIVAFKEMLEATTISDPRELSAVEGRSFSIAQMPVAASPM